jgi:hypothetical protein
MRIIALSDIHNAFSRVNEILQKNKPFDLILLVGDLTTAGSREQAEEGLDMLKSFEAPLLGVGGNMDPTGVMNLFRERNLLISGKGTIIGDVGFFGVSGCPSSLMHTPNEYSEEEIAAMLNDGWDSVKNATKKVLISHCPPFNTNADKIMLGKHVGSKSVRTFVDAKSPDLVLCGHIHEARGIDQINRTQIVNCGPANKGYFVLVDIGEHIHVELRS